MSEPSNRKNIAPGTLGAFLEETLTGAPDWSREDLQAVFRHQWSAPLSVDLSGLERITAERVESLAKAHGLVLKSFGDLLAHPSPPVELLQMTKDFAKRCLYSPSSCIPHDVARVLYFMAIGVARLRCGERISELPDAEVQKGIQWVLKQEWLTDGARDVLNEAHQMLSEKPEETA